MGADRARRWEETGALDQDGGRASPSATAEAELLRETERARLRALVAADVAAAAPLHADDFQLITPGGGALAKADYLGRVASGAIAYRRWEPDTSIAVRLYGDGAVLRYRARAEVGGTKGIHTWHTDVYERRDGRWQVVWSQATVIQT